jgi:formate dehydrogenase iron-sulfur subunit
MGPQPPTPITQMGFLTDTTLCIGCKACEVACKQWNGLRADGIELSGKSYDNTLALGATTWRHVAFVEQFASYPGLVPSLTAPASWLLMSDVCKHCQRAGCMDACPTGAIARTEFGSVFVQPDICNGCGYCVPACPFGVVQLEHDSGLAQKCTLCYDRLKDGLEPACAKSCPTDSIQFGTLTELKERAQRRVAELHGRGVEEAYHYGADEAGGLNASFILLRQPETYNLPRRPRLGVDNVVPASLAGAATAAAVIVAAALTFLGGRR